MLTLNVRADQPIDSSQLSVADRFRILFRLQHYVWPHWDKVLLRLLSTLIMSFLLTIPSLLMPYVIDDALPNKDFPLLVKVTLLGALAYVLIRVLGLISGSERGDTGGFPTNVIAAYTMSRIAVAIKIDFLRHIQFLSMGFYTSRPVGEHMFRSTLDCDDAAYLASEFIPRTVGVFQRVAVLLLVIQGFGTWLLIPVTAYLILFFIAKHLLTTGIRHWDRRFRVETQRLEAVCREVLFPWKLVRGYTLGKVVQFWYGVQACRSARGSFMRNVLLQFDNFFTFVALGVFVTTLGVATGWLVLRESMTLGEYTAVGVLMAMLVRPFEEMITTFQLFRQKLVPAERMLETLDVRPSVKDPVEPKPMRMPAGRVEFQNVSFRYDVGLEVLHDVSFVAKPGEKVAICGPTGAGKSTLLSLIVRLYDPDGGAVLLDNVDVRELRQEDLRRHMAIVPQTIDTFTESIAENIRYGNPLASDADVERAAHIARVDEFSNELAQGLDTVLKEGGSLSGGQKQRLCLARALVRDPKVLLLDEATSALDPVTEKEVVAEIDAAFGDRTRIVVAHNVVNARTADRIYVLDDGRIVETGTHETLMTAGGRYRALWSSGTDTQ